MTSRLASFVPLAGVALAIACQGNPPVHTGDGLLEFGTQTVVGPRRELIRTTRLSLYEAAPFDHWGFHASALTGYTDSTGLGPFDLTSFPLHPSNNGTSEPFMRYTSTIPFWRHGVPQPRGAGGVLPIDLHDQHEIDLFARDPAEQAATVRALPDGRHCVNGACGGTGMTCAIDHDCQGVDVDVAAPSWLLAWEHEWAFGRSPFVPRMMYPPQPNLTTFANGNTSNPADLVAGVVTSDFWAGAPTGPGAAPDGSGSIKTVKILNHGVCGAFQPYATPDGKGLLQQLDTKFPQFVLSAVAQSNNQTNGTCDTLEQRFLVTSPYLDFSTDDEDAQHGGFFFGTQLNLKDSVTGGGPNFLLVFKEELKLFDGRLSSAGEILSLFGQGSQIDSVLEGFPGPLTREMDAPVPIGGTPSTVAEAIWSISYGLQRFNGIPQLQLNQPFLTCDARPDGRVLANDIDQEFPCAGFVSTYSTFVKAATMGVGASVIGLNSDEQQEALAQFDATENVGGDTVWKNFRCADLGDTFPDGDPRQGQRVGPVCYYELPAKRLNAYPDGVELVFLDQLKELENPVFPIWLMLLEFEAEGLTTTLSPLCDDSLAQTPGSLGPVRSLQALPTSGHATFNCTGPAADCGSGGNDCCCDQVTVSP